MKTCSKCKQDKPLTEFRKDKSKKDGYSPMCKTCRDLYPRDKRKDQLSAYRREYGLSPAEAEAVFERAGRCCQLCGMSEQEHMEKFQKRLSIDHNHQTGTVRGILCHNCNTALGKLLDNPILLAKAIVYVVEDGTVFKDGRRARSCGPSSH